MSPQQLAIREQVDLRHLNTFHVSAKARWFVTVTDSAQLPDILAWQRHQQKVPFMLIGQGSNILFKSDYPGLIIELHNRGIRVVQETADHVDVEVQAGEIWHDFVMHSLDHHWYGLENLSLIPGTVGAAPVQNIGAYGVEVKQTLLHLDAMEIASGAIQRFTNADCRFDYRQSWFKQEGKDRYIICAVTFRLDKTPKLVINYPALQQALKEVPPSQLTPRRVSDTVCFIRRSKLPDPGVLGNAGSFFFNPRISHGQFERLQAQYPQLPGFLDHNDIKVPAAWLIEQAGWKGYREGDVGVHNQHALVLVNHGNASGAALVALSEKIQASVLAKFDIQLWPEVRIV
ncbi:MAG TPA: UDP-N-acetylmuramate dehydrogenase [Candidatus Acidoferrum sp.]|nr:UDP-N-acetylmuramate dehydrogenase [Candidatus Acidoferrum sp.]